MVESGEWIANVILLFFIILSELVRKLLDTRLFISFILVPELLAIISKFGVNKCIE